MATDSFWKANDKTERVLTPTRNKRDDDRQQGHPVFGPQVDTILKKYEHEQEDEVTQSINLFESTLKMLKTNNDILPHLECDFDPEIYHDFKEMNALLSKLETTTIDKVNKLPSLIRTADIRCGHLVRVLSELVLEGGGIILEKATCDAFANVIKPVPGKAKNIHFGPYKEQFLPIIMQRLDPKDASPDAVDIAREWLQTLFKVSEYIPDYFILRPFMQEAKRRISNGESVHDQLVGFSILSHIAAKKPPHKQKEEALNLIKETLPAFLADQDAKGIALVVVQLLVAFDDNSRSSMFPMLLEFCQKSTEFGNIVQHMAGIVPGLADNTSLDARCHIWRFQCKLRVLLQEQKAKDECQ